MWKTNEMQRMHEYMRHPYKGGWEGSGTRRGGVRCASKVASAIHEVDLSAMSVPSHTVRALLSPGVPDEAADTTELAQVARARPRCQPPKAQSRVRHGVWLPSMFACCGLCARHVCAGYPSSDLSPVGQPCRVTPVRGKAQRRRDEAEGASPRHRQACE